jgi:hypothetical protein
MKQRLEINRNVRTTAIAKIHAQIRENDLPRLVALIQWSTDAPAGGS